VRVSESNQRLAILVLATGAIAFLIGYGITVLTFRGSAAPADVVMVPDVTRLPAEEGGLMMQAAGLAMVVGDSLPNPDVPAGAILAQTPLPGYEVAPGAEVRVILSTGSPRPTVPEVEAMPVALATRALQAAGFDVLIAEAAGPVGQVMGTDPPSGTSIRIPATIRLLVGAGVSLVAVPDLRGMREADARQALLELGIDVGEVNYQPLQTGRPNEVVEQSPAPGEEVAPGTPVDLRVNLAEVIGFHRQPHDPVASPRGDL